jgi:hypothetical protein
MYSEGDFYRPSGSVYFSYLNSIKTFLWDICCKYEFTVLYLSKSESVEINNKYNSWTSITKDSTRKHHTEYTSTLV